MSRNQPRFIHLRTHSEHSLLEGAVPVANLVKLAQEAGMPAVALTDTNAMFAALEFSVKALDKGVQPIVGCQISVQSGAHRGGVVALAQSAEGWLNLMALSSCIYLRQGGHPPHVTEEELIAHAEGLILLSGGADGPVGRLIRAGDSAGAGALLKRLHTGFGDRLYVELQRHKDEAGRLMEAEAATEDEMVRLAYDLALPLVATNDVYFPTPDMFDAHDALICIAERAYVDQSQPRRRLTPNHDFKTAEEMAVLFADLPEAIENTVEIARRCAFAVSRHKPILPRFAADEVDELRRQAREGLADRLRVIPHAVPVAEYEKRLDFELGIIEQMGFPGYF
ncbi:MAG: PHP domain-containing protein, partial [Paracoccus sp. (in: a-proteobacteria)]|nr:PHP domain-containing protein [Paracoccus sp. (in: a-proteobacteria)]